MALARLKFLSDELGLNETGYDEALKELLKVATEFVQSMTGRILESATYTNELYTGRGRRELWLRQYPVISITSIDIWDGSAYTTESSSYYSLRSDSSGEKRFAFYPILGQESSATYADWPEDELDNIRVTYVAGYVTTGWDTVTLAAPGTFAVPKDLEYAVAKIASLMWLDAIGGDGRLGVKSVSIGGGGSIERTTYERLPDDVRMILGKYKRRTF